MNPTRPRLSPALALALAALLLGACNTQPQRPPPPRPVTEREPPPPASTPAPQASPQEASAAPAAAPDYGPASADAAEVEFEEVPVDGSAPPASAPERTAAGGGGAPTPPAAAGASYPPPPRDDGGVVVLTGEDAAPAGEVSGPQMRIGARTQGEQVAALDAELDGQLAAFDERMRRARAAAEAEREALESAGGGAPSGAAGGRGYRLERPPAGPGAGGAAERSSGLGNTPDLSGSDTAAEGNQVAAYAPPPGIPDGRDDDIVARQLREAASKESDPVLREKLWEEYRKYKAGL